MNRLRRARLVTRRFPSGARAPSALAGWRRFGDTVSSSSEGANAAATAAVPAWGTERCDCCDAVPGAVGQPTFGPALPPCDSRVAARAQGERWWNTREEKKLDARLQRKSEDFLAWLRAQPDDTGLLPCIRTIHQLRVHAAEVCNRLLAHPACHGQLVVAPVSEKPDLTGSYIPPVRLHERLAGASLFPSASSSAADAAASGTRRRRETAAVLEGDGYAPDYTGVHWTSSPPPSGGGGCGAIDASDRPPWERHLERLCAHYTQEQAKKRKKVDTSTYAESLMESLVGASIDASPRHRWYAQIRPTWTSRHLTYNFLQEVAIAEHCKMIASFAPRGIDTLVDFGGGNGILAFAAGKRLGTVNEHVVVDKYTPKYSADVSTAAGDPYHRRVAKYIQDVEWHRDLVCRGDRVLGVSKHLCGNALDQVFHLCERSGEWPAAFALSSCCHHKLQHADYINRAFLRGLGINDHATLMVVARKAGWQASENPPWLQLVGATVEALFDLGRVLWLRERGYAAFSVSCMSAFLSPRNRMIVAWRRAGALTE